MCYRAKNIDLKAINGTHEESYAQVWDYENEIKRVMPKNTVAIELEDIETGQERDRFKRIYICLGPLKRGYKVGCRPVIGLDGCHIKGPFGGQLLTAVGTINHLEVPASVAPPIQFLNLRPALASVQETLSAANLPQ